MTVLPGTPSDDLPAVLATGSGSANLAFVSMSASDPEGRDAEYLEWHTYDHRVEQHRIEELRASMRLRMTPALREATITATRGYEQVVHVMTYLFASPAGLPAFDDLGRALFDNGRFPFLLPGVDRGVWTLHAMAAAPRIKIGAQVLPWWPADGAFLLLEETAEPPDELVEVPGVAGIWTGDAAPDLVPDWMLVDGRPQGPTRLTIAYLDDDPRTVAAQLRPVLDRRWSRSGVEALLAAPFVPVNNRRDWERG